jgi:hypothetical protein
MGDTRHDFGVAIGAWRNKQITDYAQKARSRAGLEKRPRRRLEVLSQKGAF